MTYLLTLAFLAVGCGGDDDETPAADAGDHDVTVGIPPDTGPPGSCRRDTDCAEAAFCVFRKFEDTGSCADDTSENRCFYEWCVSRADPFDDHCGAGGIYDCQVVCVRDPECVDASSSCEELRECRADRFRVDAGPADAGAGDAG